MEVLVLTSTYPSLIDNGRRLRAPDFVRRLCVQVGAHFDLTVIAPTPMRRRARIMQEGIREEFFPFFPHLGSSLIGEGGVLERLREKKSLLVQAPFLIAAHFFFAALNIISKERIIIHAHWLVYCGIIGWALKKLFFWKDIRLVVTIHGSDRFFFEVPIIRSLCGVALRSCDAVTCVNLEVSNSLRGLFCANGRHMPMGVPAALFAPSDRRFRESKTILFVGRIVVSKGVDRLLSALTLLEADFHLLIVGDGPYVSTLCRLVSSMGLEERVTLLGWVDQAGVKEAMAMAGCLVLPSDSEGFSLTVLEAMASGLPVVANDIPSLNAQLRDGRGYLVDAANALELADAIGKAINRNLRMRMLARDYAEQFRWERVGAGYRLLYDEVSR